MPDLRRLFGNRAERYAARFLRHQGYRILTTQYRGPFGEVDVVARDGDEIVFVEVKARKGTAFGHPEESVTASKLEKIAATAEDFLRRKRLQTSPWRIDVVALTYRGEDVETRHIKSVG